MRELNNAPLIATAIVVKKTRLIASAEMGLMSALKSCQDVCEAASNNKGGKRSGK